MSRQSAVLLPLFKQAQEVLDMDLDFFEAYLQMRRTLVLRLRIMCMVLGTVDL